MYMTYSIPSLFKPEINSMYSSFKLIQSKYNLDYGLPPLTISAF